MAPEQRAPYLTAREALDSAISEREFQAQVVKLARLLGWRVSHPWLSIKSTSGVPDLLLCRPPRLIFMEVKRERGKLTAAQQGWLNDLQSCPSVECYMVLPHEWLEIVRILEG